MEWLATDGWIIPAFFLVAALYASAGFGGGSSYLALLALSGIPTAGIRPIALICNLAVTTGGSLRFFQNGITPWRRALPLVLLSVPAAFLGGQVSLQREDYLLLLGGLLVVAGMAMLLSKRPSTHAADRQATNPEVNAKKVGLSSILFTSITGGLVGFISGVVGIGGGIFLSPILFLTRWASPREIAATTSLFIALNSLAGLAGQFTQGITLNLRLVSLLFLSVIIGGQIGTHLTLRRLSPSAIRIIASLLILFVGLRLVFTYAPRLI